MTREILYLCMEKFVMMRIAFYVGLDTKEDKIVKMLTGSDITHCEIVFSDDICFSARPKSGTTYNTYTNLNNTKIWKIFDLPWITEDQEKRIRQFCNQESYCKYDWMAVILGRINPMHNHPEKWFCSEICSHVLRPYTKGLDDFWYTPGRLYCDLKDNLCFNLPQI